MKIGQLYKGSAGSTFSRWEDDWTYYDKGNCNLALTTADVNNDAMLAKIKSVSTGYTDPKVMAILEASPHFAEVNDGDIGNSQTGIGYSKDHSETVTASGSFGFDIMAGFEYVAPLIETGGGVEFNTSHTFTVGATKSTSKKITVEYSNDTNDNMVLMYATLMTYYEYQVKYPDGAKKGNSPKLTSSMTLAVPGNPSMNMVSVDTYNKAASAYEGMQQIGSNLHLGTSGQPNTYRSSLPSGSHSEQSGKVGHYKDSGTQLQSFTTATSSGVNFEYTYEGSVQMYGVVGGFKAGGGYHWGASAGTEKVNTNTITKLGSVTGGDSRYNFDWSFGTWTVPFNGDEVPVLGYVVSNVTAPPSPAQDLSVDYVLAHKMMNGVSSRAFAPNANLTRGMLVQILYNLEGKPKGTAANFSDVQADAWYAEAVGWAASNKVVTGYADGTFRPNAAVTREQAAAILYRYAQSKGIDVSVGENTNILSYVDVQQASEYAIPALQWAVGAGVLNGKNGGRLAPTGTATRAEIAAIMQRWCENIIK